MKLAQKAKPTVNGEDVACHVAGDPGDGMPIIALSVAGVLRRSELLNIDGSVYRVGTLTFWPADDLRRYVLTPV